MFIAIIFVLIFLDLIFLLFFIKKVFLSNKRKAIYHHKKSSEYAEKGDYEKAKLHSEISKIYREKIKR